MDPDLASRLRQQAHRLRLQRRRIEARLLKRRSMLRASFITRYLGTSRSKRSTPATYLSFRWKGRTVLRHVAARERGRVERRARAWSEYSRLVARWVKVCRELERCWRALGEAQSESPAGPEEDDGR